MSPLTHRQAQAMRAMGIAYLEKGNTPASARTVARRMPDKDGGSAPLSAAHSALRMLKAMGLVQTAGGLSKDRAILWQPTERGRRWLIGHVAWRIAADRRAHPAS
ncbi:hypothetical protein [Albimonas pacifica]|nr:hypothetical protein [Albimonas pacifica]